MTAIRTWLVAGTPPNYVYLAGLYALTTFVLLKIPKVRANSLVEALFNAINPYVLPLVSGIPIFGPLLAKMIGVLDTPVAHEQKMPLPKGPAMLLPLLFLPLLTGGCLLKGMPTNATLAVKLKGDAEALEKIAGDVSLNCGAELASFGKTVVVILAVAATYEDLLADVSNAAKLYQDGKMDIAAVACVINTVRADVKALTPEKKAMLERLVAELEAGQSLPMALLASKSGAHGGDASAEQPRQENSATEAIGPTLAQQTFKSFHSAESVALFLPSDMRPEATASNR